MRRVGGCGKVMILWEGSFLLRRVGELWGRVIDVEG